jgi:sugar phosphate isomerase/epimerase
MRLGVVTSALLGMGFDDGLDFVSKLGLDCIEVACAGFHRDRTFGDPQALNHDGERRARWLEAIHLRGLCVSALAIHGEPLSPDRGVRDAYAGEFRAACELASEIGVANLVLFAGLPEAAEGDRTPCWITSAFPPANLSRLEWQWEQRVLPYWRAAGAMADDYGCRLCFEMHPSDVLHHPAALRRLADEIGPVVRCNFDPSHLWWQGIDPLEAIDATQDLIAHVHAKDTQLDDRVVRRRGVLDATPFDRIRDRAWSFRTVGFGHDALFWRTFVSRLRAVGYDDVLSIEHEDEFLELRDGVEKAVGLLAPIVPRRSA